MTSNWRLFLLPLLFLGLAFVAACDEDAIEEALNEEAAPLAEDDLPNCSRVINCCNNLKGKDFTPDDINTECDERLKPTAQTVIDNYKDAKSAIDDNPDYTTDQGRDEAKEELKGQTQNTVETGCRCFLDETIGSAGEFVLYPSDCEYFQEVGNQNIECSEATTALFDAANNSGG